MRDPRIKDHGSAKILNLIFVIVFALKRCFYGICAILEDGLTSEQMAEEHSQFVGQEQLLWLEAFYGKQHFLQSYFPNEFPHPK